MDDEDDLHNKYWIQKLYLLQEKAPRPNLIPCSRRIANKPPQYGAEYHGLIERSDADQMLRDFGEGAYLVRASKRSADAYTLGLFFDGNVLNYKLYYDGMHFVAEKRFEITICLLYISIRFETLDLLVADGLITMFVEKGAAEYIKKMADEAIYEQSPYSQYNRANEYINRSRTSPQQRSHSFTSFTFKMPHYCDYCRNFLWGLVQQGLRCEYCGFAAHKKCSEKAQNDCHPDSRYVKRMFAVDLTTLCLAHSTAVPPVVTKCIDEVNRRGLQAEGIYRVSGSHEQMDKLRKQFDVSASVDLSQVDDIHTVAGLLKLYLRLLPQQLVPFNVFRNLLDSFNSTRSPQERKRRCWQVLEQLNYTNRYTLEVLLDHLRLVSEHSKRNKMTAENICTIFSPTIFCTGIQPSLPQNQHQILHLLMTAGFPDAHSSKLRGA
ncbi:SH2 motif and Protein kinase C and RhoGAP domain containing protein [Aphelenchoides besseyi]|nr:SH2 motif and Protein kinase C and RhoGAP domain containing protein [Aphelenchoides besseyi]